VRRRRRAACAGGARRCGTARASASARTGRRTRLRALPLRSRKRFVVCCAVESTISLIRNYSCLRFRLAELDVAAGWAAPSSVPSLDHALTELRALGGQADVEWRVRSKASSTFPCTHSARSIPFIHTRQTHRRARTQIPGRRLRLESTVIAGHRRFEGGAVPIRKDGGGRLGAGQQRSRRSCWCTTLSIPIHFAGT
jgi:hypothetical protein